MKKRSLVITIAIVGLASSVLASDKAKDKQEAKPKKAKQEQRAGEERKQKVEVTGSYIKRDVRRNGRITDGPSQVVVLDRETIEKSGAGDLKQLLIRQGIR